MADVVYYEQVNIVVITGFSPTPHQRKYYGHTRLGWCNTALTHFRGEPCVMLAVCLNSSNIVGRLTQVYNTVLQ